MDPEGDRLLGTLVKEKNDRTLAEYAEAYERQRGVRLSRSALHRAMVRLNLPRKKKHSASASRIVPT